MESYQPLASSFKKENILKGIKRHKLLSIISVGLGLEPSYITTFVSVIYFSIERLLIDSLIL